jgi:hypothetical protein
MRFEDLESFTFWQPQGFHEKDEFIIGRFELATGRGQRIRLAAL